MPAIQKIKNNHNSPDLLTIQPFIETVKTLTLLKPSKYNHSGVKTLTKVKICNKFNRLQVQDFELGEFDLTGLNIRPIPTISVNI